MKKLALALVFYWLVVLGTSLQAQMTDEHLMEDVKQYPSCSYCGMDRHQFSRSRMLIHYDNNSTMAACSIHCAAIDLAVSIDKTPGSIQVADYKSGKLIDAEPAIWVIGGSKPGVMTKRAKWAFDKKVDAEEFIKQYGGSLATFDDAMKAAYEDMYTDTKMIRDRRKAMKGMSPSAPMPAH